MKLKCENCFCEFEKPQKQKTCSRKCSDELKLKNNREIRKCFFCKEEFEVKKISDKKLCSDECRKKWAQIPENKENRIKKSHESLKNKYDGKYFFQTEDFVEKSKKTKIDKYGHEIFVNHEKAKSTKKEKYGDENYNNMSKNKSTKKERYGDENYNNRNKATSTMNEIYGVDYAIQKGEFKEKQKLTNIERYGVSSLLKNKEVRDLGKKVMKEKYGVEYAMQNQEIFQKCLQKQFRILKYKDLGINYQGSYEKYFLELMEEKGLLSEISNGDSFVYIFNGSEHTYHVDFKFRGKQIEIKSGWTYNKNGKDLELQSLNEAKWKSAREAGANLVVLIDKSEVKGFVKAL